MIRKLTVVTLLALLGACATMKYTHPEPDDDHSVVINAGESIAGRGASISAIVYHLDGERVDYGPEVIRGIFVHDARRKIAAGKHTFLIHIRYSRGFRQALSKGQYQKKVVSMQMTLDPNTIYKLRAYDYGAVIKVWFEDLETKKTASKIIEIPAVR